MRWAQTKSMWPDTFGLACCAIEMMSIVSLALRPRPLRDGGVPLLAAPGRPADRLRPRRPQDGGAAAPDLRPDARAEVGDRDGRLRLLRRDVQQLHDPPGGRPDRPRRHLRPLLPAAARGADGGDHPPARGASRRACRRRTSGGRWPRERAGPTCPASCRRASRFGETTVDRRAERIREACLHARDELGFDMCVDVVATDYLDWARRRASPATSAPRAAATCTSRRRRGSQTLPAPKPKRFSLSYHLLALQRGRPARPAPVLGRRGRAGAERRLGLADLRLARARAVRPDGHPSSTGTRT